MKAAGQSDDSPCYAVIFSATRTENLAGYDEMDKSLTEMARRQPGFMGLESIQQGDRSITISYWQSLEAIQNWKNQAQHQEAQKLGQQRWYANYRIQICRIERAYSFNKKP